MGCCYLKAEPFLFFHLVLSFLGSQSYLDCCYLKAEPFILFSFFLFFFFSSGSVSLGELVHFRLCFYLVTTNLSLNLDKIKFTCLDGTYPFLYRLTFTLTMKNRDEKAMFVLIKKLAILLR